MKIITGDSLEILKKATSNSVDAIVTDPPYGLSFMGKKWDYDVPSVEIWKECYRVLKPGGYLLSFAGTRTQHRMAVNIEDAGFEIRDMIAWVYGSGFPKSLNIGKAVDKLQGNEREDLGLHPQPGTAGKTHTRDGGAFREDIHITKGNSEWEGWGTALKPALEPITVARKPLSEKTVAENVLKWGTGGINIDGSRIEIPENDKGGFRKGDYTLGSEKGYTEATSYKPMKDGTEYRKDQHPQGRFPANLIHDGSDEVVSLFPDSKAGKNKEEKGTGGIWNKGTNLPIGPEYGDNGSAARFFYCAKASKADRDEGLEDRVEQTVNDGREKDIDNAFQRGITPRKNVHPTVKPTKLMQYLVKLVTPKGGTVLDPFMGSGSTGKACKLEGFDFIGIEREPEYVEIAKARIGL